MVLLIAAVIVEKTLELPTWQLLLVYLVPYFIIGAGTLKEAAEGLAHGDPFNEHFLMTVATIGALCIGFLPGAESEFTEAVFVMLFFQVGEYFEGLAEGKSRASISHLMDIRPDVAHVKPTPDPSRTGGVTGIVDMNPDKVAVGSVIEIRPGEKVPLDGTIVSGKSSLNTMALTGESVPLEVNEGDDIISGSINLSGVIEVRTTKAFGESTVSRIIKLVEEAGEHKSQSEAFITRFARIYTPIVVFLALAIAIIMPMGMAFAIAGLSSTFFNAFWGFFPLWLYRAKVDTVVFDKTGTLTHGRFSVVAVHPEVCSEYQLLHLAAHVEHSTTHPIGAALRDAFPSEGTDGCKVTEVEEIAGKGIRAKVGDKMVCVGNTKMMDLVGVKWHQCDHGDEGTIVHVAIAEHSVLRVQPTSFVYAGHIVI